jgi:acetoin utilization protein AcuB
MKVRELMSRQVVPIGTADSCREAMARMHKIRIRHLPVLNRDGLLVGVITDRDLRHYLFSPPVFRDLGATSVDILFKAVPVARIMSTDVVATEPDADVADAARLMVEEKVGSLPVLENSRVVGMLTETDVLRKVVRADATCAPECAEIIISYP